MHGSVLHAMLWAAALAGYLRRKEAMKSGQYQSAACIARNIIPRVSPPCYCVQYDRSKTFMASNLNWTP